MIHSNARGGLLLAAAGFVAALSGQAFAGTATAQLQAARTTPVAVEIDARLWKCEAGTCTGVGDGRAQSLKRECMHVAAELGALKAYSSENGKVEDAGLAACNAK